MSNYRRKIIRDLQDGEVKIKPGAMYYTHVLHDDWCHFLCDKGECNCQPETSYKQVTNAEEWMAEYEKNKSER